MTLSVNILRNDWADQNIPLPRYETVGAAGADLRANFRREQRESGLTLGPNERRIVPTGLSIALPQGYEMQIRPRSGLAIKHGVTVLNAPGTIDSDYRGEIGVILVNLSSENYQINHGDRIAQAVIAPVIQLSFNECERLDDTDRGRDGFGSTGKK